MKKNVRMMTAAAVCRTVRGLMHLTGRGGTALPGKAALAIDRNVLEKASRNMHVIVVTGTNGKTTTCHILEQAMILSGRKCLLNRSGANLLSGITAEFVCNVGKGGTPAADFAVIECDEGALKQVTPKVKPEVIVVTNLFRDQLDRYGEVMNTRAQILAGIRQSPESILCLNADCPLTASIADEVPNPVLYYGLNVPVGDQKERELTDAKYCVKCSAELVYSYYTCDHLGSYSCPECGFHRPGPETAVTEIAEMNTDHSAVRLKIRGREYDAEVSLPAVYNLYNTVAAVCAGNAAGIADEILLKAAGSISACFGRMENFSLGGKDVQMILVKNPAGCNQALDFVNGACEDYDIVFCLNDKTADGHDISWIWDADYEKIVEDPRRKQIFVSGIRAEDMQLRLKYAGAEEREILLEKDFGVLLQKISENNRRVFILPNYTSMLELRKVILRTAGGEEFWK